MRMQSLDHSMYFYDTTVDAHDWFALFPSLYPWSELIL
jgi:hypothetical protein